MKHVALVSAFALAACHGAVATPASSGAVPAAPSPAAAPGSAVTAQGASAAAPGSTLTAERAPATASNAAAVGEAVSQPGALARATEAPQSRPYPFTAPEDVGAVPAEAMRSDSGLAWRILKPGDGGEHPGAADRVKVNYSGWRADGRLFDSSLPGGEPLTFPLDATIPGFSEAVQQMSRGEQVRVWIPARLAYGEASSDPRVPTGNLVFDIELVDFLVTPPGPATPEDVAAPPAGAMQTKSGVHYRVLTKGKGQQHPTQADRVRVHYSGWTTDGKLFDSSVVRGEPSVFPVRGVIAGFAEAVMLMVPGEKRRVWIPAELAYGNSNRAGAPQGMLVFEIELLEVLPSSAEGQ